MSKLKIILLLIIVLGGLPAFSVRGEWPAKKNDTRYSQALYWEKLKDSLVQCRLCPRLCVLKPGEKGFCKARKNIKGKLFTLTYGYPVALHPDPIEKKPLFHVYPGSDSYSIATAGCNLRCKFCQNWEISQVDAEKINPDFKKASEIVRRAKTSGCKTIAFTYTEPTIFYEYMLEISKIAANEDMPCVMHSAGYINEKPLRRIAQYIKAANIDLKGFNDKFYSSYCNGDLSTVLRTLKILKEEGVWIEITNLIIPGANDDEEELKKMCNWIKENLGAEVPLHFSRFFPMHRLINLSPTPVSTLLKAKKIARDCGLKFVYVGNVPRNIHESTYCPNCNKLLIKRVGYSIIENNIENGRCPRCGENIPGLWQ
ncbi:MAG: AmmeMemoRadiSam system radical SAM enzyme [Candidatus Omnitrophica bacterium]|nr:AmmeMemoRadiSam system radical SAM enzyme [Candidatus Omnitrophota bacterium]MBD3269485.1 AmmeMemoRadiSam system radical SAM enzyme [Candidatus Omnitrophota bacterium]